MATLATRLLSLDEFRPGPDEDNVAYAPASSTRSNTFRRACCCSVSIRHPPQRTYDLLLRLLLFFDGSRKSPSAFDFGSQLINLCSRDIVAFNLVADSIVEIAVFVALYVWLC